VGEENTQLYYYHGDHLGSAQLVTDYKGEIYEQLEYTPYGELWVEHLKTTIDAMPFRFTGKERDSETGLYYFGARYLNPQTSMWLSADPAMGEYIPQAPINDEAKKQNQNLPGLGGVFNYVNLHAYHYAGNNPVVLIDPDGRDEFGREILWHYLFGEGKPLFLDNQKWSDYMKNNSLLHDQIENELQKFASQNQDIRSRHFFIQFHAEIENGESVDGYQYLHGTNSKVGDFQLSGYMYRNEDGTITFTYTAQWNDIIDPNFSYDTDVKKAKIAKIISLGHAKGYTIRIKWDDRMTITPNKISILEE
jgi:RHS repeat-associated protein